MVAQIWQSPPLIAVVLEHERYRGALVDAAGSETPITDEMVVNACRLLEHVRFQLPRSRSFGADRDPRRFDDGRTH